MDWEYSYTDIVIITVLGPDEICSNAGHNVRRCANTPSRQRTGYNCDCRDAAWETAISFSNCRFLRGTFSVHATAALSIDRERRNKNLRSV